MSIVFCKKIKKVNEIGKWQKHRIVSKGIQCNIISPDPQTFSAEENSGSKLKKALCGYNLEDKEL